MVTNASEQYLAALANRCFLKLWTLPNPHRCAGKELADLLVAFGDDLIVFSDKASTFDASNLPLGWKRWHQRTIVESIKQLAGATRALINPSFSVFLDSRAARLLPFDLSEPANRRVHLVAVARPAHDPTVTPAGWQPLTYADRGSSDPIPFEVGPCVAMGHFVHVFDGQTLELLLAHLDTAPDFICYLRNRECALSGRRGLIFSEPDLLALAANAWTQGRGFTIELPDPDASGFTYVPNGLWQAYTQSDSAARSRELNAKSRLIDNLIDHFHIEYEEGRYLHSPMPSYNAHESALRILGGESRFGRRVIATELVDILTEEETNNFWASTVPSKDIPGVRYVWLAYPQPPESVPLEEAEAFILNHLRQHTYVARLTFQSDLIVGIAVPNRDARALSYMMFVLDGSRWTTDNQREAEHYRSQGIFASLQEVQRLHVP